MHYTMFEKIGLALIIFAWLIYGGNFLSGYLITVDDSNVDSLRLVAAAPEEAESVVVEAAVVVTVEDLGALMASASADAGQKLFKNCKACHTVDKGGKNKVGPNLWNIVDSAKGSVDGFKYSNAMTSAGGNWSAANLNAFITKPGEYMAGTKMMFKGIKKATDRAALIVFLSAQSD